MGILYKLFKGLIDNGSGDTEKKERWNCEQDLAPIYIFSSFNPIALCQCGQHPLKVDLGECCPNSVSYSGDRYRNSA
jgi:hypothetical protein